MTGELEGRLGGRAVTPSDCHPEGQGHSWTFQRMPVGPRRGGSVDPAALRPALSQPGEGRVVGVGSEACATAACAPPLPPLCSGLPQPQEMDSRGLLASPFLTSLAPELHPIGSPKCSSGGVWLVPGGVLTPRLPAAENQHPGRSTQGATRWPWRQSRAPRLSLGVRRVLSPSPRSV